MLDDRSKNHKKIMEIFCFYEELPVVGVGKAGRGIGGWHLSVATDGVCPDRTEAFGNSQRVSEPEHTCQPYADDEIRRHQRCGLCQC
jgi:hypothetical protein